jgi:hypothetical protein
VRKRASTAGRAKRVDVDVDGGVAVFRTLGWSPRDAVAFVAGTVAAVAILINVLFMQSGTHPAPMFKGAAVPVKAAATDTVSAAARPRPAEPATGPALASTASAPVPAPAAAKAAAPAAPRTPGEIITEIQRELARRGYYDGTVDGLYGPKTDAAIEKFERERKLPVTGQASDRVVRELAAMTGRPLE